MWIDTHCHLNHEKYPPENGVSGILTAMNNTGVIGAVSINCCIASEFNELLQLVMPLNNIWCTIGTHPHYAELPEEKSITLDQLVTLASSHPKIIGIGECGLDYYYDHSNRDDQRECFKKHIRACLALDMPIIIHARDADDDIINIIRDETNGKGMRGIMHCFSSSREMGLKAIDLGLHISFSGIITFKKSQDLRDFARDVPLDRLLVETDAPYLAPEPYRGQINTPAYVPIIGEILAGLKGISSQEMAKITTNNFLNLFKTVEII